MTSCPVDQFIPEAFRAIGYIERIKRLHFERQQSWKDKYYLPDAMLQMNGSSLCFVARESGRFPGVCIEIPPRDREAVSLTVEVCGGAVPASTKETERVARLVATRLLNESRNTNINQNQKD